MEILRLRNSSIFLHLHGCVKKLIMVTFKCMELLSVGSIIRIMNRIFRRRSDVNAGIDYHIIKYEILSKQSFEILCALYFLGTSCCCCYFCRNPEQETAGEKKGLKKMQSNDAVAARNSGLVDTDLGPLCPRSSLPLPLFCCDWGFSHVHSLFFFYSSSFILRFLPKLHEFWIWIKLLSLLILKYMLQVYFHHVKN